MKHFNTFAVVLLVFLGMISCKEEVMKGDFYGQEFEVSRKAYQTAETYTNLSAKDSVQTQLIGEITEVCQSKGCWMKVKLDADNEVFVRFKDYGFFVPKDAAGKKVAMNGAAFLEEMSVDDQRHFAEDEGASEDEIALITAPKKTLRFEADGVLISN